MGSFNDHKSMDMAIVEGDAVTTCNRSWSTTRCHRLSNDMQDRTSQRGDTHIKVIVRQRHQRVDEWVS